LSVKIAVTFDRFFKWSSYGLVACGVLTLAAAEGISMYALLLFAIPLVVSGRLEGTRWQLTERKALVIILLTLPLFYLDWSLQTSVLDSSPQGRPGVGALAHFTLLLTTIKLFQAKADRDWIFLYLISFFQVLLAAGLTVSPIFFLFLALYVFVALMTVVCFELRKAARIAPASESRLLVAHNPRYLWRKNSKRRSSGERTLWRLPVVALGLFVLIFAFALPIFLVTPRASDSALAMSGGTATRGYVGFTDSVTLGDIGRLQESNQLVMRVRVEGAAAQGRRLFWRGVALDDFDGRKWRRSVDEIPRSVPSERNLFQLGTTEDVRRLTTQTFFIEPIDTPVLFAAPRAVAVQGALPYLRRDGGDALTSRAHPQERISYRVYSDTIEPDEARLRADRGRFTLTDTPNLRQPIDDYLEIPETLDTRIASLAALVIMESGARNIYDAARAVEAHLNSNQYGGQYKYSLEMRASGPDPVADFLFNVRAGHCEYYATAMALMLRTQGFPTRIVNGFQTGEYNSTADAYMVRQADAHSWVEVYFPETDAWVAFDPTPLSGRPSGADAKGLRGELRKYADALELLWIQYVVAYDKQEQQSLAHSLREKLGSYGGGIESSAGDLRASLAAWWERMGIAGGADGLAGAPTYLGVIAALALIAVMAWLKGLFKFKRGTQASSVNSSEVAFYKRMLNALEARGFRRDTAQTPLEFASALGAPEALIVTDAYHRVRYGGQHLTSAEAREIDECLRRLETPAAPRVV
jgi:hypothetical protein